MTLSTALRRGEETVKVNSMGIGSDYKLVDRRAKPDYCGVS
jgi:hypothetical protein